MDLKSPLMLEVEDCLYIPGVSKRWMSIKNVIGALTIVSLVIITTCERFSFKLMVDRMESYRYFIAQTVTALYIPPLFLLFGYNSIKNRSLDEEMRRFPKLKFIAMAALDVLQTMMIMIPGGKVPPPLTVLLVQISLPITVLFSMLILKRAYYNMQIVGAFLIFFGALVSLFPVILGVFSDEILHRETAYNTIVYFLSAIPASLSALYKEQAIRSQPMDLFYLNAWTCFYQFILGLFIAPLVTDIHSLYLNQRLDGFSCLFSGNAEEIFDNCQNGFLIVLIFVLCDGAMNWLILHLLKTQGSFTMYTSITISVVISFIMMELYQFLLPYTVVRSSITFDLIGVTILLLGFLLYRAKKEPEAEIATMSADDMEAASLLQSSEETGSRYT